MTWVVQIEKRGKIGKRRTNIKRIQKTTLIILYAFVLWDFWFSSFLLGNSAKRIKKMKGIITPKNKNNPGLVVDNPKIHNNADNIIIIININVPVPIPIDKSALRDSSVCCVLTNLSKKKKTEIVLFCIVLYLGMTFFIFLFCFIFLIFLFLFYIF